MGDAELYAKLEELRVELLKVARAVEDGSTVLGWMGALDARELRLVAHCVRYMADGPAGLTGHALMVVVARLAWLLERLDEAGATFVPDVDEEV